MPRGGDRFSSAFTTQRDRVARHVIVIALMVCSCSCNGDAPSKAPTIRDTSEGTHTLPVGNPARGIEAQPDYDALARELRGQVAGELPDPLPSRHDACDRMLTAAAEFYRRTEGDPSAQLAALQASHDADLAACERDTSAEAASCVVLLSQQDRGELPWLLDQCSRAFP